VYTFIGAHALKEIMGQSPEEVPFF
jgi:hypothetical protein